MTGPKEKGFWSSHSESQWRFLVAGKRYRVIQEFTDFDQVLHPFGETWVFAGYSFLPYDNGLSLFVQNDQGEWHMRLQLIDDEQGRIGRNPHHYFQEERI